MVLALFVFGFIATTSTSFACYGNGWSHGSGVADSQTTLTTEQQAQLDSVKAKYSQQLDVLQTSLNDKAAEYRNARVVDSTTVGALKRLEVEISGLEGQYWTLLDKINREAGQGLVGSNVPWFNCGYDDCDHQNHMGNMHQGRHMGPSHRNGMDGWYMGCNW